VYSSGTANFSWTGDDDDDDDVNAHIFRETVGKNV